MSEAYPRDNLSVETIRLYPKFHERIEIFQKTFFFYRFCFRSENKQKILQVGFNSLFVAFKTLEVGPLN